MKKLKNQDGVGLVEIILGIVVISTAFLMAMRYYTHSVKYVNLTEGRAQAVKLAADITEDIKARAVIGDWDDIEDYIDDINLNTFIDTYDYDEKTTFTLKLSLDSFDFDGDGTIDSEDIETGRRLTVTIKWNDDKEKVSLKTLITDR
ncbi:MAG: hypothetical protein ACLFPF_08320 [Halanaerobiales bacterium]